MGEQLKKEILARNGIISSEEIKIKPLVTNCPRCDLVNQLENKYCSKCSYPLKSEVYDEIKLQEEIKLKTLESQYKQDLKLIKDEMNQKFEHICMLIQKDPKLSLIKPTILLEEVNRE